MVPLRYSLQSNKLLDGRRCHIQVDHVGRQEETGIQPHRSEISLYNFVFDLFETSLVDLLKLINHSTYMKSCTQNGNERIVHDCPMLAVHNMP